MSSIPLRACSCALTLAVLPATTLGQTCAPEWGERFPSGAGVNVRAMATFDPDATGPLPESLYLARGSLVDRWDGTRTSNVTSSTGAAFPYYGDLLALTTFDSDGAGPTPEELIVAGTFVTIGGVAASNVARWDGTTWSPLGAGVNNTAAALRVFDEDGAGPQPPRLFVGGSFTSAGGVTVRGIARWDGTAWSAVASVSGTVSIGALATFDADGSGAGAAVLIAGGSFTSIAGVTARNIARWNGVNWAALGPGSVGSLGALAEFDPDGPGPGLPRLYAGSGVVVGSHALGVWDGSSWSPAGNFVDGGSFGVIWALRVHDDDGAGPVAPALYVGGEFTQVDATIAGRIARWDGTTWSEPTGGIREGLGFCCPSVKCLGSFDDDGRGKPARLFAGGFFGMAGSVPAAGFARWDGTAWLGMQRGLSGRGHALAVADLDGAGPALPALFAGGAFEYAADVPAPGVVRWNGVSWSSLGSGLSAPPGAGAWTFALAEFDEDGVGPNPPCLFVAGRFDQAGGVPALNLARWNGSTWSDVGFATTFDYQPIRALAVYDDDGPGPGSPALFVGGYFTSAGGVPAASIARWDGSVWSPVGSGTSGAVECLAVADLGSGARLYAGGTFSSVGGVPANNIASWNGTAWSALGTGTSLGTSPVVHALHAADLDGSGPGTTLLYAGGGFQRAGGVQVNRIAAWNGAVWSALGAGLGDPQVVNYYVRSLTAFDPTGSGSGPRSLYAGGFFSEPFAWAPPSDFARWDGTSWTHAGDLISDDTLGITALAIFDEDGAGTGLPGLYATGEFDTAGPVSSERIARLGCTSVDPETFCAGDGSGAACPCANSSLPGDEEGCLHSLGTGGRLRSTGVARVSLDSLTLLGTRMPNSSALYFQGTAQQSGGSGVAFGDGKRCAAGAVLRLGTKINAGGASQYPEPGDQPVSVRGGLPASGGTREYQVWYRNAASFCTESTFNLTNGLEVLWQP